MQPSVTNAAPPPDLLAEPNSEILPIDLPTALRLTNANNPTIALAREHVEEAYAAERQADVAWLPNLQAGPQYNRHDGRDQTTQGPIIEVSKQNLYINGGATLDWNTSDILFGPLVAERLVARKVLRRPATERRRSVVRRAGLSRFAANSGRPGDQRRHVGSHRRKCSTPRPPQTRRD